MLFSFACTSRAVLIDPTLQQHQPVGVRHALEDLELLAAGLLGRLAQRTLYAWASSAPFPERR